MKNPFYNTNAEFFILWTTIVIHSWGHGGEPQSKFIIKSVTKTFLDENMH